MNDEILYSLEFIRLQIESGAQDAINAWVNQFVIALNIADRNVCRPLLRIVKSVDLSKLTPQSRALIFLYEALFYVLDEQLEQAILRLQQSLKYWRDSSNSTGECQTLRNLGVVYRLKGEYEQSRASLLAALEIASALSDNQEIAPSLNSLGQLFEIQGKYDIAEKLYLQSIELTVGVMENARNQYRLGVVHHNRGQYKAAIQNYQMVFVLLQQQNVRDIRLETETKYQLGVVSFEQGDYDRAMQEFQEALSTLQSYSFQLVLQARVLCMIGVLHKEKGQQRAAVSFYEQADAIIEEVVSKEDKGLIQLQKGLIELEVEQAQRAIDFFEDSHKIFKELNNIPGLAETYAGLGKAHANLNEYSRASDYFYQALSIFETTESNLKKANVLFELGTLLFRQGAPEAESFLQQALQTGRDVMCKPLIADCLLALGRLNSKRGDSFQARDYYFPQSIGIYKEIQAKPKHIQALLEMGQITFKAGDFSKASEYFFNVAQIAEEIHYKVEHVYALHQMETIALLQKNYSAAYKFFQQAQIHSLTTES